MDKIINFEEAKLKYEIARVVKRLNKIYNDIDIYYYFLPEVMMLGFVKTIYKREVAIQYIELKQINPEIIIKHYLDRFTKQVYEKRESELYGEEE